MTRWRSSSAAQRVCVMLILLLAAFSESPAKSNDAGRTPAAQAKEGVYFGSVTAISGNTLVITIDPRLAAWGGGPNPDCMRQWVNTHTW
jgi:hypothetical protein